MCPNPATLLDSVPVSERRDVVVVGGGLVGVTLAYELASMGSGVTVVDARTPGRATAAGAGILSPVTSVDADPGLWPFLRGCGAHYPGLLERLAMDGVDVSGAAYGRCGLLSVSLRPHEDEWFGPFAEMVDQRSPGQAVEIAPEEASALFPPLGSVHRALHAPSGARVDGQGMAAAVRAGAEARGVIFVAGTVTGLEGSDGRITSVEVDAQGPVSCETLAVAGGAWTSAMGEWLACPLPVGPTKGQIVHLGVDDASGDWEPIVQPLLSHYLVPWPGGRVACGGTFEVGAGFSTTVSAAGLHELLRECLVVAPGLSEARYLEDSASASSRPTSPDDHALVGVVPGWSNAFVVTGHGANGLLQGPYSGAAAASPRHRRKAHRERTNHRFRAGSTRPASPDHPTRVRTGPVRNRPQERGTPHRKDQQDVAATVENVQAALAGTAFFWLDLDDEAHDGSVAELLTQQFKFHPLRRASGLQRFPQRPRLRDFDDFMYMVARGADPDQKGKRRRCTCFWTDRYLVTSPSWRLSAPSLTPG